MYYCAIHQIAYERPRQLTGHYLYLHPGAPRPSPEAAFVEQVPEGTMVVPYKAPRHDVAARIQEVKARRKG